MKKISIVLLCIFACIATSCSADIGTHELSESKAFGKWVLVEKNEETNTISNTVYQYSDRFYDYGFKASISIDKEKKSLTAMVKYVLKAKNEDSWKDDLARGTRTLEFNILSIYGSSSMEGWIKLSENGYASDLFDIDYSMTNENSMTLKDGKKIYQLSRI